MQRIAETAAPIVIDLGCGEGTYSDLARGWRPDALWIGVEIWEPYVEQFELWRKYDIVAVRDARELNFPTVPYVLLAGDVLEHMHRQEAVDLLARAKEHAEAIMVSLPIIDYPQHGHDGNPYEAHLHQWTFEEMYAQLPTAAAMRGAVLGRFWWRRPGWGR